MGWKQYQWSSSSDEAVDKNIWDAGSYNDDGDGLEADNDKEEDDDEMEDEDDADDEIEEEDDDEAEEVDDDDTEDEEDDDEAEEVDDDDQAEEVDDDEEDDDEGRLNLRLWPGKRHLRIKLFSGKKWRATKVYRLTWANHEELEDLFESSFKMDIGAPIPANTIFRNKDCLMDFELYMLHTPLFDELIAEFRVSVTDFKFCQEVGGEDSCRVFKCLFEGRKFALKTLRLKEPCIMEPREVEIISSLHDKRVMAFYQAWVEPWIYKKKPIAYYLFIQLELCRSTLQDLLLPENFDRSLDRWNLSEEIAKAVKTIHDESILHRDLKPANIFFGADLGVRIGDFGDSCIGRDELGGHGGTPRLGTQYYSAPELQFAQKITEKADMYSVGVMFLEIFTRFRTAFGRITVFKGLGKEEVPDSCCNLVGDRGVHGLVRRMIAVEPADRPSDTELLEYLEHNFTSEGLGDGADESQAEG